MLVKLLKKLAAQAVTTLVRHGWPGLVRAALRTEQSLSLRQRRQQCVLRLMSVAQGASLLSAQVQAVLPPRSLTLKPVRCVGLIEDQAEIHRHEHRVDLPEFSITVFHNLKLIGGTEILCADDVILYDELAKGDPDRYGCKAFGIIPAQGFGRHLPACTNGHVLVSYRLPEKPPIPRGIHLCKDHSGNYFHWLFECLPRAIMALRQTAFADFPLLIDGHLPKQNLQALEQIAAGREIIRISHREMLPVGELVFPGVFSFMRDNYGSEPAADDLLIAPEAVHLLREAYLSPSPIRGEKRLFVARDGASYRRLLNEKTIHRQMLALGFEIVRPELLSFAEQVAAFSEAAVIVGPTGAGLSNMVFAPEGCKVIVLAGATKGANHFIFGQLAQWLNHELVYVCGAARNPAKLHSDYVIDIEVLRGVLAEMDIYAPAPMENRNA